MQTSLPSSSVAAPEEHGSWAIALFVIVLSLVIVFHPVVFGGKTTAVSAAHCNSIMPGGAFGGDHAKQVDRKISQDPWSAACQSEAGSMFVGSTLYREHKIPLWNMYSGCGLPFISNFQNQLFSPLNLIIELVSSNWAIDTFVLVRLLIAGILTFLALRVLMPGYASLIGAIGYMLTGYFLSHLNLLDLNVHITIPALLLSIEAVVRKPGVGSLLLCSAVVANNLLAGHPECSLLTLTFSGCYLLVRLSTIDGWRLRAQLFGSIAAAYLCGLLIALPEVLPFVEYVRLSDNCHDPAITGVACGLDFDHDWRRGLLSYIFPAGWAQNTFANGFYGAVLAYLALVGATVACSGFKASRDDRSVRSVMLYFVAAFSLMLLKRFGVPPVNWIGALPLFNMVLFCRYDEPLMGICIATLAAFGLYSIQRQWARPKLLIGAAVVFWLAVSALNLLYLNSPWLPALDSQAAMKNNMLLGLGCLTATVLLCLLSCQSSGIRRALPLLIIIPFLYETCNGFMSRTFYGKEGLVSRSFDAFKGAPYIEFLKKRAEPNARVLGLDGLLQPNWSASFNIQDIRYIDSLTPKYYAELISTFLPNPAIVYRGRGFDATEKTAHDGVAIRRLCQLTSVKYLLCMSNLNEYSDLIVNGARKFSASASPEGLCFVPLAEIDGVKQPIMFQHPKLDATKNAYDLPISVPDVNPVLEFDFVRSPDVACPVRSTPVQAIVSIDTCDGSRAPERFVFQNNEPLRLHATHYRVDLTRFAGKQVTVSLTSRPTSAVECPWEWVGWKKMRFCERDDSKCVYDREIKIYELPESIPHAAVFTAAEVVDDTKVLSELQRRSFSPQECVVFSRNDLPKGEAESVSELNFREQCRSARISKYESDNLEIELPAITRPSLLLLTDNCFPGWRATVDGKEQRILRGNHCFRAVLLPVGARAVRFVYDPWAFKAGMLVSVLTLAVLALLGVRSWSLHHLSVSLQPETK